MPSFTFRAAEYPALPGCYIMKSEDGRILYVGKSKSIRARLRSYFHGNQKRQRITQLVEQIASIEVIVVNNEHESLLLENNLIKVHKPPFNRALKKDNSGYAYLQMTDERYPRLAVYYRDRRQAKAEAHISQQLASTATASVAAEGIAEENMAYFPAAMELTAAAEEAEERFGPFASSYFRDQLLLFVNDHYQLRTCDTMPKKVCLLYHLKRCSGVCEGMISEEDYRSSAREAASLLRNQGEKLIEAMRERMAQYAERLEFERAAHMLEQIRILERVPAKQIVDREAQINQDVVYFGEGTVLIAKVRQGMLHQFEQLPWERGSDDRSGCDRFLIERYAGSRPDEVIVSEIGDQKAVARALRIRGQAPVRLIAAPKRGIRYELMQLCKANYEQRNARSERMQRSDV
ncbi:excinuclease ABC subunit C [Paenibacillus phyllosphaerae]|uniref:Excinuclease ABC subunit C n=1 Tax=Paenibacillus phyllosphaerae TaxID=274593 RepID=A0A7W5B0A4_9BACL|nr:GIY-YIG nuclease family protein [Paenibacillus phyllosphaerae]MBB3112054.1 excinuclease ABC subunit C [Paenibacillus phyllosphaerae]